MVKPQTKDKVPPVLQFKFPMLDSQVKLGVIHDLDTYSDSEPATYWNI